MVDKEKFRLNYFALYPQKPCLIKDGFPPVTDSIEGFDFVLSKIICERIKWEPSLIQICLKDIKNISESDLTKLANLFLNKNNSGDKLSYNFREVKEKSIIHCHERIHIQYEDELYFFIYYDGSGFGFIKDIYSFPETTRFFAHEYLMCYDLLREMGYALPYLNFSVKEMISLKWIHIIDNQQDIV